MGGWSGGRVVGWSGGWVGGWVGGWLSVWKGSPASVPVPDFSDYRAWKAVRGGGQCLFLYFSFLLSSFYACHTSPPSPRVTRPTVSSIIQRLPELVSFRFVSFRFVSFRFVRLVTQVTPKDCCRRFVRTYRAWEERDKKVKEKQLSVKRRGAQRAGRGDAVLATCCLSGRSVSCAETIINMGGDLDNRSSSDGATPLLRACEGGNPHVVKLLLDKGADRTAETRDGRNAMHIAGQFKWPDLVEVLLDEGAPLCTLRTCGKCKLIQKLIQRKRERARSGGAKNRQRTAEEKQAALDAALKAFEQEFGTFEDEVAKEGALDRSAKATAAAVAAGGWRGGRRGREYVRLMQSMLGGAEGADAHLTRTMASGRWSAATTGDRKRHRPGYRRRKRGGFYLFGEGALFLDLFVFSAPPRRSEGEGRG